MIWRRWALPVQAGNFQCWPQWEVKVVPARVLALREPTHLAIAGAGDLAADVSSLVLGVLIHLVVTRGREALAPAAE